MKTPLLSLLVLPSLAFGSVDYFAGSVDFIDSATGKKEPVLVLYERVVSPERKQVVEAGTAVLGGKRFKHAYVYDHAKGILSAYDENDKLASRTKFQCEGQFPKITSCSYELTTDFYTKGRDVYHGNTEIEFDASVRDLKKGVSYVTRGKVPSVPEAQYRKLMTDTETKFPLAPSASLTAAE